MNKPDISRSELITIRRALAQSYEAVKKEIKRCQTALKAGKKPRNQVSALAMEGAEYIQLFEKLNEYVKATGPVANAQNAIKEG